MPRSRSLMVASSTAVTALLTLVLALPAAAAQGPGMARSGHLAGPAAGGNNDFLNSDSCTSSTFCMAIGDFTVGGQTPATSQVLKGSKWVTVPVPSPSHGVDIFANEVSCASPTNCLFVGEHQPKKGAPADLAEVWNGSAWRIVTDTGPTGSGFSQLNDVACPTTKFCLVVGLAGKGKANQDTAFTWTDGKTWKKIAVPHPAGARASELGALACFNAFNCMAAGTYANSSGKSVAFAARWHAGRWSLLAFPSARDQKASFPEGIACPAVTLCVAAATSEDNTKREFFHALTEVWSGGKWRVSSLRQEPSELVGASCPSRTHCFVVGDTFPTLKTALPVAESWNGRTWTVQHPVQTFAPHHADSLQHISCVTRSHCEAVGLRFAPGDNTSNQTLAEAWNGHRWTVQATPNP